jgi:cytochrome oxidase Cu insertion factor (SCO1/SenC/PrrC family)
VVGSIRLRAGLTHYRRSIAGVAVAVVLLLAACSGAPPSAPSANLGAIVNRSVPVSVSTLVLTNQQGHTFDLASLRGKHVMLVPFLTLCSDICPMTTANLGALQRSIRQAGQGSNIVIVELSVDPARDSPSRLAAYAGITGATWELVTESPQDLATIARFFGFSYQQVPQDDPPAIDWLTHQPLTYDIDHSDGFAFISPAGREVFATAAAPDHSGPLPKELQEFLTKTGIDHQRHPPLPGWTADQAIQAAAWLLGAPLPPVGS